jgi:carboxymethylenebutenolidase
MTTVTADKTMRIAGVPHYLARAATRTTAGVLLLPHVTGVDHFVTEFADELAARGLTTLAWNPYPDLPMGAEFKERPPRPKDEASLATMASCLDAMQGELGLREIATIGFCMGGRFVLLLAAREKRLRCGVACYPSIPAVRQAGQDLDPVPAAPAIACPLMVVYPGQDRVTPRPVFFALQALLQGRTAETSILYYPEAEHGFMHTPSPVNDAATRTAKPQIHAFFETHLRGS